MAPVGRTLMLRNTEKSALIEATALTVWPGLIAPVVGPELVDEPTKRVEQWLLGRRQAGLDLMH